MAPRKKKDADPVPVDAETPAVEDEASAAPETGPYGKPAPRIEEVRDWVAQTPSRPLAFDGTDYDPAIPHSLAIGHTPDRVAQVKQELHRKGYRPVPNGKDVYCRGIPNGKEGAEVWYTTPEIHAQHMAGRQEKCRERLDRLNLGQIEGGGGVNPGDIDAVVGSEVVARAQASTRTRHNPEGHRVVMDQQRRAAEKRMNKAANLGEI